MVFGLFSKERALKKAIDKATNNRAQSVDRWAAMQKLADAGGDEAYFALCKRFSFKCDKLIEDQQEKDWTKQTLIAKGEVVLPALKRYMKSASSLGHPLSILEKIAGIDKVLEAVDEVLATEEPGYVRDPKRRIDVVEWLSEYQAASDEQVASRVAPYMGDFDENVRFKCTEALALRPHDVAADALAAALVNDEEESKRLKLRIAEVLADNDLDLGDHRQAVAAMLDDVLVDFRLQRNKLKRKN